MGSFVDTQVRQGIVTPNGNLIDRKGSQTGVAFADAVHGEYAAAALDGRLFTACNQAAVATTTTLNTTFTGLSLTNPTNSGKLLLLREFSWMLTVVGSDEGGLALADTTIAAPTSDIVPTCAYYGRGASVAIVGEGDTVVAGTIIKPISTYGTGAITTWQGATQQVAKLGGSIIIPPGRTILTDTTTATTAAFIFGFLWEEVAI